MRAEDEWERLRRSARKAARRGRRQDGGAQYGCTLVARGGQLLGIFTTTDALRVLVSIVEAWLLPSTGPEGRPFSGLFMHPLAHLMQPIRNHGDIPMFNPSTNPGDHPFVMVIGLDLRDQDSSGYAFDQAMRIASRIGGCETHVVYVMPEDTTVQELHEGVKVTQLYVSEKATALGVNAPRRAGIHVRRADPVHGIAQLASDVCADLIVVGTRPSHVGKLWVGSTAERVMASTPCPVFVAGPRPEPQPSHVIAIEPPCPDCVQQRFATRGRSWWCERHSEPHHLHRHHVYSYQAEFPFATHDSTVTSTGMAGASPQPQRTLPAHS